MTNDDKPTANGGDGRCRKYRVTGRVQGVFFRDSTRQVARKLNLTGYARNNPDGSVEVVACGRAEALDSLADWLRAGPPMALVSDLQSTDLDLAGYQDFTIG